MHKKSDDMHGWYSKWQHCTGITQRKALLAKYGDRAAIDFSYVDEQGRGCRLLASDKLRSYPVYCKATALEVGTKVETVRHHPVESHILRSRMLGSFNQSAAGELLNFGYITGHETLSKQWQQLPAAHYLVIDELSGIIIEFERYWAFDSAVEQLTSRYDAVQSLHKSITLSVQCLLDYAQGRPLILPLSGGYDSRLLLLALKRLGATNVSTFTFGLAHSHEVSISRQLALYFDVPWRFVPYSRKSWQAFRAGPMWVEYTDFVHGLISSPNLQVFPALQQLRQEGFIANDAILVPGHTGDFISGGHALSRHQVANADQIVTDDAMIEQASACIQQRHARYNHRHPLVNSDLNREKLSAQLSSLVEYIGQPTLSSLCEAWECEERQAKFIVNSNRYYEFLGLDWYMPLWDDAMVDCCRALSTEHRQGQSLWFHYIDEQLHSMTKGKLNLPHADVSRGRLRLAAQRRLGYFLDPNGLYGVMQFKEWLPRALRISSEDAHVHGFLAAQMVRRSANYQAHDSD